MRRGASFLLILGFVAGCSTTPEPPSGARYVLRAVVRDASKLVETPRRLRVEHEAVDDLVGVDGTVEPMASMTMTLVVWEPVLLPDALKAGDKVRLVVAVDWQRSPTALIVEVARLPADQELALGGF